VLTESPNLHGLNRRLAQRIRDLEDRLSEVFGQQACARSGLGAPTASAALQDELEHHKQLVLDLTSRIEELDEELAQLAKPTAGSWPNSTAREHLSNAAMHWHDLPKGLGNSSQVRPIHQGVSKSIVDQQVSRPAWQGGCQCVLGLVRNTRRNLPI
jgi:hypothetical protein